MTLKSNFLPNALITPYAYLCLRVKILVLKMVIINVKAEMFSLHCFVSFTALPELCCE